MKRQVMFLLAALALAFSFCNTPGADTAASTADTTATAATAENDSMKIIAYYTGSRHSIDDYDLNQVDQLIFCFLHLKGNQLTFDAPSHKAEYEKLVGLKQSHPGLTVLVSLGGWGGCEPCSEVFSSAENRTAFAQSVKSILEESGGDGIDLDWEYPGIEGHPGHPWKPEDKQNFTALVQELRSTLGDSAYISFAAGGFPEFLENSVEWDRVMPLLNNVNLMTYDLVGGYSTTTGHHTALYSRPEQVRSTDQCVQYLLKQGVPADKMIIGAAFYARTWENVPNVNNGLYQSGKFKDFIDYNQWEGKLGEAQGFTQYWDDTAKAPYAFNHETGVFATFDNERSIKAKVAYARQHNLGGIMFWELPLDKPENGFLQAIKDAVNE